jgi:hypothetical protein
VIKVMMERRRYKYLPWDLAIIHLEVIDNDDEQSLVLLVLLRYKISTSSALVHQSACLQSSCEPQDRRRASLTAVQSSSHPSIKAIGSHVQTAADQSPEGQQRHPCPSSLPQAPRQHILNVRQPRHRPDLSARPSHPA